MDYLQFESKITVPKQSVQDLLVCAFEGGSNYWYDNLAPLSRSSKASRPSDRFYEDLMTHGFSLTDKETGKHHIVRASQFVDALKLMHDNFGPHFHDVKIENSDAETGDVFLQLLVFKDVIYG